MKLRGKGVKSENETYTVKYLNNTTFTTALADIYFYIKL